MASISPIIMKIINIILKIIILNEKHKLKQRFELVDSKYTMTLLFFLLPLPLWDADIHVVYAQL